MALRTLHDYAACAANKSSDYHREQHLTGIPSKVPRKIKENKLLRHVDRLRNCLSRTTALTVLCMREAALLAATDWPRIPGLQFNSRLTPISETAARNAKSEVFITWTAQGDAL